MTNQEFNTATHILNCVEQAIKKSVQKRHIKYLAEWLKMHGFEPAGINWRFKNQFWELWISFEYIAFEYFHIEVKKGLFTLRKDISETILFDEEMPDQYLRNFHQKYKTLMEYMNVDTDRD